MNEPPKAVSKAAVIAALAAFGFWGLAPIYFKWLASVPPLEIIAHRVLWAIPVLLLFLAIRDGKSFLKRLLLPRKVLLGLLLSGFLVASNWLVFVWAVSNDRVLATSLGYFITPLVNVLLGVCFLKERLSRLQIGCVLLAASGTIYLAFYLGQTPWVSLLLAVSFGFYGLVRKQLSAGPMTGLLWEATLLAPLALGYLAYLAAAGAATFSPALPAISGLLIAAGLVTVLPLIWYNVAARGMPYSTLGYFQYLGPSISFLLAVFLFDEVFTRGHAVAFSCIWVALLLISSEPIIRARRFRLPS